MQMHWNDKNKHLIGSMYALLYAIIFLVFDIALIDELYYNLHE